MNLNKPLETGCFYHIYNRGINGEDLFKSEKSYTHFLKKYDQYLSPVVDTFAYCLLKNHFHILIRVKEKDALQHFFKEQYPEKKQEAENGLHSIDFIVSKQFARLFSSFTQTINKIHQRKSSLFDTPFKRIHVANDVYFTQLIWYIHFNPQKHHFVTDFREYPHSSYHSHLSTKQTKLYRQEVLSWFGGKSNYETFHNGQQSEFEIRNLIVEF